MRQHWPGLAPRPTPIGRALLIAVFVVAGVLVLTWRAAPTLAQATPTGPDIPLSVYTDNHQGAPAAAVGGDGRFVVAWESSLQDGSGSGVYARRFDPSGAPQGVEFRVNETIDFDQDTPAVSMVPDGRFVVAWMGDSAGNPRGVYTRRYAADGTPLGGEVRANPTVSAAHSPRIALASDGGYIVIWTGTVAEQGVGIPTAYGRVYGPDGAPRGPEIVVGTIQARSHFTIAAMVAPGGAFAVAFYNVYGPLFPVPGATYTIETLARRFAADGTPEGAEQPLPGTATSFNATPTAGMAADGRFVVAWDPQGPGPSGSDIVARRFAADRTPLGPAFTANALTTGNQRTPSVAVAADGRFLLAWESLVPPDGAADIYARQFGPDGAPRGGDFSINTVTAGVQRTPSAAISADGRFAVIAWQSDGQDGGSDDVYARRVGVNEPPSVTLSGGTFAYQEGSGPQVIDGAALVGDSDSVDLAGGQLTIELLGGLAEDRLSIRTESTGLIQVAGNVAYFRGAPIGTLDGGTGGAPLVIALTDNATPSAVQALLRRVAYENLSLQRSTAPRTLRVTLSDGDGEVGLPATRPIQVVLAGGPPGCAIRPRVRINQVAGEGRLLVAIQSSPLTTGQPNPLVRLRFDDLVNARVRFNGFPVAINQSIDLPPNTTATELTVERAVPGQSTTVHLTVVDTCGDWKTLVGGGMAAGF